MGMTSAQKQQRYREKHGTNPPHSKCTPQECAKSTRGGTKPVTGQSPSPVTSHQPMAVTDDFDDEAPSVTVASVSHLDPRQLRPQGYHSRTKQFVEFADSLGEMGALIWQEEKRGEGLRAAAVILLLEICRQADQCQRLDQMTRGHHEEWMRLRESKRDDVEEGTLVLMIDSLVSEARQSRVALKTMVGEFRQLTAVSTERGARGTESNRPGPRGGGGGGGGTLAERLANGSS